MGLVMKKKIFAVFNILFCTFYLSKTDAAILEHYSFETGDLSQVSSLEIEYETAEVSVTQSVSRAGNYAMKAYIEHQDKRAESVSNLRGTVGGENWYAWSVYIPADYAGDGLYDIFTQFHDWHQSLPSWADDGRAPTNFTLQSSEIKFSLKFQSGPETIEHTIFSLGEYTPGEWHDFVMHVKWTHESSGFVQIWLNGDLKVDYVGETYLDYGSENGPYFKMGNYKGITGWEGSSPRVLYMDEYRMGDQYSSYEEITGELDTNSIELSFSQENVSEYQVNNDTGEAVVVDEKEIQLSGNAWKKHTMEATITSQSLLQFTLNSIDTGEILAIGIEGDDNSSKSERITQLSGTQIWEDIKQLDESERYEADTGESVFVLPIGESYQGDVTSLLLIGDDDADASTAATFSNVELFTPVNLNEGSFSSYGEEQDFGEVSTSNNYIFLQGNSWKKYPLPYLITENTVIRFNLQFEDAGEILGIGLDENNDPFDNLRVVQLAGSQIWGDAIQLDDDRRDLNSSDNSEYEIAIGQYYTGVINYLVFSGDDDDDASTNAVFSNIRIFEK